MRIQMQLRVCSKLYMSLYSIEEIQYLVEMEKLSFSGRESKIIHLGGRTKLQDKENILPKPTLHLQKTGKEFDTPYTMAQPIIIRYIDPRIVPLFMELGKLTKMVENIAMSSPVKTTNQNKEQLQTLIRSTKQINEKVSVIMQENSASFSSGFSKIGNKPQQVRSEYQYHPIQNKSKLNASVVIEKQPVNSSGEQIDMVQVLNKVSQRLEELQEENESLKGRLLNEIQKRVKVEEEKAQLQQQLKCKENMEKAKINQIQEELVTLEKNSSIISHRIAKMNLLIK